jgi:hypothetical protein
MKRWFLFFKRTDPKSCHFDPETHPIDLSFLKDARTPQSKLEELLKRGEAGSVVHLIDSLYRDRVLSI